MEDGKVNLLVMEVGVMQFGWLVFMEFGFMYSNDWFLLLLCVFGGGLFEVEGVEICDVFGQWFEANYYWDSFGSNYWNFFGFIGIFDLQSVYDKYLLLLFGVVDLKESLVQEEVYLACDEMVNMVWGIEYYFLDGIDGWWEGNVVVLNIVIYLCVLLEEVIGGVLFVLFFENEVLVCYWLVMDVLEYWIFFKVIFVLDGGGAIWLQWVVMFWVYFGLFIEWICFCMSLLWYGLDKLVYQFFFILEEEVFKLGIWVFWIWQCVCWYNGWIVFWSGFCKQNGWGQGNSGLWFDGLFEWDQWFQGKIFIFVLCCVFVLLYISV